MNDLLANSILVICLLIVFGILMWGVITMGRGGEYNKSKSNLIMRYRIIFQAIAIIVFVFILYINNDHRRAGVSVDVGRRSLYMLQQPTRIVSRA